MKELYFAAITKAGPDSQIFSLLTGFQEQFGLSSSRCYPIRDTEDAQLWFTRPVSWQDGTAIFFCGHPDAKLTDILNQTDLPFGGDLPQVQVWRALVTDRDRFQATYADLITKLNDVLHVMYAYD